MGDAQIVERDAVRAVLLTPSHEVLLMRVRPPNGGDSFWVTPGGGMAPGEDVADCLRRELREELGLEEFTFGPLVWRRQHTFNWAGRRIRQRERYHVIGVEKFVPRMLDPLESQAIDCLRWWSVYELSSTRECLRPLSLAEIVASYIRDGAPQERGPAVRVPASSERASLLNRRSLGGPTSSTMTATELEATIAGSWVATTAPNLRWEGAIRATAPYVLLLVAKLPTVTAWAKSRSRGTADLAVRFHVHSLGSDGLAQLMLSAGDGWIQNVLVKLPPSAGLPSFSAPHGLEPGSLHTIFVARSEPAASFGVLLLRRSEVSVGRTGVWRLRKPREDLSAELTEFANGARTGTVSHN